MNVHVVWILWCGLADEYCLTYCVYLEAVCLPQSNYIYLDLFVKWKVKVVTFLLLLFFLSS